MSQGYYSLGTMSGTSMDGVDVALLYTDGIQNIRRIAHQHLAYPPEVYHLLKSAEYTFNYAKGCFDTAQAHYLTMLEAYLRHYPEFSPTRLSQYCALNVPAIITCSTQWHLKAITQLQARLDQPIDIIGYHGQTLYHNPDKQCSIQIGHAETLAHTTGLPVVTQFRQADLAAGGQGAPLAPLYHQALAMQYDYPLPCGFINLGGIANVSLVTGPTLSDLYACDLGPANILIDRWVSQKTQGVYHYDRNGLYAKKGTVDTHCLDALNQYAYKDPTYPKRQGCKSLDAQDLQIPKCLQALSLESGCATLTAWSIDQIIQALDQLPYTPKHWVLSGGGFNNPFIYEKIHQHLSQHAQCFLAAQLDLDGQAMEAELFAYLAVRHLKKLPLSTPNTTGVLTECCGGLLTVA